jgi:hypothetical protein
MIYEVKPNCLKIVDADEEMLMVMRHPDGMLTISTDHKQIVQLDDDDIQLLIAFLKNKGLTN